MVSNIKIDIVINSNPDDALNHWHSCMIDVLDVAAQITLFPRRQFKPITVNTFIKIILKQKRWLTKKAIKDPMNVELNSKHQLKTARKRLK